MSAVVAPPGVLSSTGLTHKQSMSDRLGLLISYLVLLSYLKQSRITQTHFRNVFSLVYLFYFERVRVIQQNKLKNKQIQ